MKPTAVGVHATLTKHYPAHVLGWVNRATWRHDPSVPLTRVDMARRPGARNPEKVAGIAEAVKSGKPMPPVVLVDTGEPKLQIADGYHRTLGFLHAGKRTIPALIATGVGKHGPWEKRMHAAKLNLTAEHVHVLDLAGVCTGPGPCVTTPVGTPGGRQNWVDKVGGLPAYIRAIAHALQRKGRTESQAIQLAIGTVQRWARGEGNVSAETRARAAAALAEWEAKKARAHALTATPVDTVDLAGPHHYRHGWIRIDAADPSAVERTSRAVMTDGHAMLHGSGMVEKAHKVIERVKAAGHRPTARRVDVAGMPHLHIARAVDLTAAAAGLTAVLRAMPIDLAVAFTEALHPRAPKGVANGGKFVAKNGGGGEKGVGATYHSQVRDFQKRTGLSVTGKMDSATRAKIARLRKPSTGGSSASAKKAAEHARHAATASAVNGLNDLRREQFRILRPKAPPGYHWDRDNRLVPQTPQSRRIHKILGLGR